MQKKIVGFTIEIDGKKELVQTEKVLKLINKQLVVLNKNLAKIDSTAGKGFGRLNNALIKTSSSASQLGDVVNSAFVSFEKGSDIAKGLGSEFKELTTQITKNGKAATKAAKEKKKEVSTDNQRITQLNKLNSLTKEEEAELNKLLIAQAKQRNVQKERLAIAKQQAILETERVGTRKALKAQLALTTIELNKLTEAEQLSTKRGKALTATQLKLNTTLFDLETRGGTFSRRVGEYARGLFDVNKAAKKVTGNIKRLALRLSVGRSVVEGLSNGIRNTVNGLRSLVEEGDGTNEVFNKLEASGEGLQANLKVLGTRFLTTFGGAIAKFIDNVSFAISVVGNAFVSATESSGFFGDVLRFIGDIVSNFPAVWGGAAAAIGEFISRAVNGFKELKLRAELAGSSINKFATGIVGGDTTQIEKNIARINKELEKNIVSAESLGEAYNRGYRETLESQEKFNAQTAIEVESQKKRAKAVAARNKAQEEAAKAEKKRIEDAKKAAEELVKDRSQLLEDIKSEAQARLQIAKDLQDELLDLQIQAIKDGTQRAIEAEKVRFERQKEERKANFKSLQDLAAAQEIEATRLFGERSKQLEALQSQNDSQLLELSKTNNKIAEEEEQVHQNALLLIKRDAAETQSEALREIEERDLKNLLAFQAKEIEAEKQANDEKAALRESVKNETINLVQTAFQAVSDLTQLAFDAENRRLEQSIDARKASVSSLNEELQNATGLQKKFLEQQVKAEEQALEQETKNKEKAQKKQAKTQQAIALGQAVVAAALGIANAFSLPPPASFIAAAATGITTAVQIATIASQKFADGGKVQANGKITQGSNIPTQSNGDNVLAQTNDGQMITVKTNEVILNEEQQRMLGGPSTFSSIGVPGFANGGRVAGRPIAAPAVVSTSNQSDNFIKAMNEQTKATNNRIDNIKVALDVNNFQDFESNEAKMIALTTMS
jgi:hypothetical protein